MGDLFDYEPSKPTGRQLADRGMSEAVDHADDESPGWSDRAYAAIEDYARGHSTFAIEDVKDHAYAHGLEKPPVPGAWGAPTKRASKKGGVMEFHSYRESRNASQHMKPVKVWRSNIFQEGGRPQ